jgi:DAK2 domain fusion protein YloV
MRERMLAFARGAAAALDRARRRIDDLNVYPVPDGDTGTNLAATARAVVEALEGSTTEDRRELWAEVSRAALLGARGNSGVILSQIVRGAADVLAGEERVDGPAIARALSSASNSAYRAVRDPVEGTILTAIRELAEESAAAQDLDVVELRAALVRRGEEAVARTPEQLAVLRDAGVVDAGAAGLVEVVRGLAAVASGEPLPEADEPPTLPAAAVHREASRYRYCTAFVVEGNGLDLLRVERELEPLGDSLLVVGGPTALKAHLHTDEPDAALELARRHGAVGRVEVADMQVQTAERARRLSTQSAVVAVVVGAGNARLFESLRAHVVDGGRSMNPSAAELVAAIGAAPSREALVLPNNPNVVLAARQAAELADKPVRVVTATSIPAGLAALVAFEPELRADDNASAMEQVLSATATGAVTIASRDVQLDGLAVKAGAYLGLLEGEPVAGGERFVEVARAVVERLLAEPRDVLTLLTGEDAPPLTALLRAVEQGHPEIELDIHEGGQPHYPLLLGAE